MSMELVPSGSSYSNWLRFCVRFMQPNAPCLNTTIYYPIYLLTAKVLSSRRGCVVFWIHTDRLNISKVQLTKEVTH